MATPFSTIYKRFLDNFSESEGSKIDLYAKRQHLRNALSFYSATISTIHSNYEIQEVEEDLSETEMLLLSLIMYDSYLDQEILKYNRIINISNEFVKMTGATDRVKTLKDMKLLNQQKLNNILISML